MAFSLFIVNDSMHHPALQHAFRQAPVTWTLIVLSCFISVITWFGAVPYTLYWLIYDSAAIQHGQIWRLLTPIFLHFPAMGIIFAHLAFNMIWLYQFGSAIERVESSRFLLVLVVVAGILSNIAQSLLSMGIFGGMSGVVYALLAYLFVRGWLSPYYPARVANNIAYFLIGFMLLAGVGVFGSHIANAAHFSGFAVGAVAAVLRHRRR